MIKLHKMGGGYIYLNEQYIETIEKTPDTTIKLHNGTTFVVKENPEKILDYIVKWGKSKNLKSKKMGR